jgi:hypothetical protein
MLKRLSKIPAPHSSPHVIARVWVCGAAGVTDKLWEIADIVALIEAKEAEKPVKRGPYKKQVK